jgi:RimJ/RimL family protein N-acetyltransferase
VDRASTQDETSAVIALRSASDGVVTIRSSTTNDVPILVDGRDDVFHRFLGDGDPKPRPTACIVVHGPVVGWVDYDTNRPWLEADEVNVGYNVFAPFRGNGYASRAVKLLMRHLSVDTRWRTATLLIHPENERSLALARRLGFAPCGDLDGNPYWKQPVSAFRAYGILDGTT